MARSSRLYSPSLLQAAGAEPSETEVGATHRRSVAGRWQQPLTTFAADGPNLPLNAAGLAAWRAYEPAQSPANTCEAINVPDIFFAPFFLFEIELAGGEAVLRNEIYDVTRRVPLDGDARRADSLGRFGSVSGRLDGETLVVESRDYAPSAWGLGIEEAHGGADVPSSAQKTVLERFTVTPDGGTLVYEYTLHDPAYMTRPHSGRIELTRVPDDVAMYRYECDVESAAMWSRGVTP